MGRAKKRQTAEYMSMRELLALPPSTDLVTAGRAFGIGRTKSHELARTGNFPCPVRRVGGSYRVPKAGILAALDIEMTDALAPIVKQMEEQRQREDARAAQEAAEQAAADDAA